MAEVDELTQAQAKANAATVAAGMPKVNPKTGELPDLFAGKFGFIETLINDPIYGVEIKKIYDALIAGNTALAETLYRKSKWAQLDTDAQDAYLLKLQNNKLYKERLKSWLINIKKQLSAKGLKADDATLEKYYIDGIATPFTNTWKSCFVMAGNPSGGVAIVLFKNVAVLLVSVSANAVDCNPTYVICSAVIPDPPPLPPPVCAPVNAVS